MAKKEYLNEENYQKTKKAIKLVLIIIFTLGISLGGYLIYKGIGNNSSDNKAELKADLEVKRKALETKGITYNPMAKYTDGEEYDLKIITEALDPSFSYCSFDEYRNNDLTKEYCNAANNTSNFSKTSSVMFGGFIIIATIILCGGLYAGLVKRREILAYGAQQVMPVAQEGIEKMTPSIGKVVGEIAKNIKEQDKK